MNGHTALPNVQFGEGTTYDTLVSVLKGWCVRLWFEDTDAILVCQIVDANYDDTMNVIGWSPTAGDYITPLVIECDKVRKVEVL